MRPSSLSAARVPSLPPVHAPPDRQPPRRPSASAPPAADAVDPPPRAPAAFPPPISSRAPPHARGVPPPRRRASTARLTPPAAAPRAPTRPRPATPQEGLLAASSAEARPRASTPRFFHLSSAALLSAFDEDLSFDGAPPAAPPAPEAAAAPRASPFSSLGDDLLLLVLAACSNSALRAAMGVDVRTRALAERVGRERAQLAALSRSYHSPLVRHAAVPTAAVWRMGPAARRARLRASADGRTLSREEAEGCGVGFLSEYITRGVTKVLLAFDKVGGDVSVGLVMRNFVAFEQEPHESRHAIVVDARSGEVFFKGKPMPFLALPYPRRHHPAGAAVAPRGGVRRERVVRSGAQLQVTVDMQSRECTFELLDQYWPGMVDASVTVDCIPHEVSVCVGIGAGHSVVRALGMWEEENRLKVLGKIHKDLWDEDNVIPPLPIGPKPRLGGSLARWHEENFGQDATFAGGQS